MEKKAPRSFSWQFKEEVAKRMLNGESPTLRKLVDSPYVSDP